MNQKLTILIFLIVLPVILAYAYNNYFRYAGNWLEDYRNYFEGGFLIIALISSFHLVRVSKNNKSPGWLFASVVLTILLAIYLYVFFAVINTSFGKS